MRVTSRAGLRLLVAPAAALLAAFTGVVAPVVAAPPTATVDVICTAEVSYGDEIDCRAASIDAAGNFGTPGTFTFDPGHVLPATWSAHTCAVKGDACAVTALVSTKPGAVAHTFSFDVAFVGSDGSRSTTTVSVAVDLRPTVTTITCDNTEQPLGGTAHCLISVADQRYDWDSRPAQLPAGVSGMSATSSGPGDVLTYDKPSANHSTCVAAVTGSALTCRFTLHLGPSHGLRTVTATYTGDPAADEVASKGTVAIANGPRVAPVLTLACPSAVPAAQLQTTCQVTVTPPAQGGPVPTGTIELDQAAGQPLPFDSGVGCTLVNGGCAVPYQVFPGSPSAPPPPVRALYAGDSDYLPASASQVVAITPTPSSAALTCDQTAPAVGAAMHCRLTVSTAGNQPVPVGPLDSISVVSTSGVVACDVPAEVGCGHDSGPGATQVGFTLFVGGAPGPQLVTASYSGDAYAIIAPVDASLAFVAVAPSRAPDVSVTPPTSPAATRTSVACGPPVAYRHVAHCLVTVTASTGVPAGTVTVAPAAGQHPFVAHSCRLDAHGRCMVALLPSVRAGTKVALRASYGGSTTYLGSAALGRLTVRAVATKVTVRCAHLQARVGAVVHCVASVRTEFGAAAAVPAYHPSQVTVRGHRDNIAYDGGRSCHWKRSGHQLTCAFSVRTGPAPGIRTVRVHYAGAAGEGASQGVTAFQVVSRLA